MKKDKAKSNLEGVLIILGSTNNKLGAISDIGISRLDLGIEEYKCRKNYKIIITGGFGSHFNRTNQPYAYYAKKYLISKGVPQESIMDLVLSTETIEDAKLSKPIIQKNSIKNIIVITSDFHIARVIYIFNKIYPKHNIKYLAARYLSTSSNLKKLLEVEKTEIILLQTKGKSSLGNKL